MTSNPYQNVLEVKNLDISLQKNPNAFLVKKVSFDLRKNEILGIVGESGSGKSITTLAIMGLLPKEALRVETEHIHILGKNTKEYSPSAYRNLRGKTVSMIFQEPMSSLNPSMRCGLQVAEVLQHHFKNRSDKQIKAEVLELFAKVKLPNPEELYQKYPHQISGGQKQRVMIAMAIACKPQILIADEPTTALDVTVQKEIILLLKELQKETGMSILFITHDLSLISQISDRIIVMYQGQIVEQGDCEKVFTHPDNTYTKALVASRPKLEVRYKKLPTIKDFMNVEEHNLIELPILSPEERQENLRKLYSQKPLLEVKNINKMYVSRVGLFSSPKKFHALKDVSFNLYEGETLGLVGESGCGKSTLANALLLLDKANSGAIYYRGKDITNLNKQEENDFRKEIQIIFQDPYSSLNPRLTIGKAIMEPMQVHDLYKNDAERKQKTIDLLERVGLTAAHFDRYPHEFSGGQRQRVGIARAIALNPKMIICDESVSALDISVQAQVLNLLNELKETLNLSYLFISHDLAVVKYMSDNIMVMKSGQIEEFGEADQIYENPQKEYTKKLIDAIPKGLYV